MPTTRHGAIIPNAPSDATIRRPRASSPLMLCDRLIDLAQDADAAGFVTTAEHLVHLAYSVFEEPRAAV